MSTSGGDLMTEQLLHNLRQAIEAGDDTGAVKIVERLGSTTSALEQAVGVAIETIRQIGDRFGKG